MRNARSNVLLRFWILAAALTAAVRCAPQAAETNPPLAGRVAISRGICVLLDDDPLAHAALELARTTELTVYCQLRDAAAAQSAREAAAQAGFLNRRIFIECGAPERLLLADNLAGAICAPHEGVAEAELLRVLHPGGKAFFGSKVLEKSMPEGCDDWRYSVTRGPDNNPVSRDEVARPPFLTQFLAEPYFAGRDSVIVTCHGRIFKALGKDPDPEWRGTLSARNAFNGALLWKIQPPENCKVFRRGMVATPETLFLAGPGSCHLIDAATGAVKGKIEPPADVAKKPFWKWLAVEGGTLFGLIGDEDPPAPRHRGEPAPWVTSAIWSRDHPPLCSGRSFLAYDAATQKLLWRHDEASNVDDQVLAMAGERIFFLSPGSSLGCLDAKTGRELWRVTDPGLLAAIKDLKEDRYDRGYLPFLYASEKAVYLAGPRSSKLRALAAGDGRLLWEKDRGEYWLLLRDDGLYAIGATRGLKTSPPSLRLNPLTGDVLGSLGLLPNSCVRQCGNKDFIFGRSFMVHAESGERASIPTRAPCTDTVITSNGMLYWGAWCCVCTDTRMFGELALGPAGAFTFHRDAVETERLEKSGEGKVRDLPPSPVDWPACRADNTRSASTNLAVANPAKERWRYVAEPPTDLTPSVAVGGFVFVAGTDGIVRALEGASGKLVWKAYTGGPILSAPSVWQGRVFVGSADGWAYAFEAASGRRLWRFRAAPVERRIPLYGALASTWPLWGGVLVEDGVAYVAAGGITADDGTHVYALDAETGAIRWQNNSGGKEGVAVHGDMLFFGQKLHLASHGRYAGPASFVAASGALAPFDRQRSGSRGKELYVVGDEVQAAEDLTLFPGHDLYLGKDVRAFKQASTRYMALRTRGSERSRTHVEIVRMNGNSVPHAHLSQYFKPQGKQAAEKETPVWISEDLFWRIRSLVLAKNLVLVASIQQQPKRQPGQRTEPKPIPPGALAALDLESGKTLWKFELNQAPVSWGLAVDRDGRILLSLEDGQLLCLGP